MVSFFIEDMAESRNSLTGQPFDGLPVYEPAKDAAGRVIADNAFPFQLVTYKEVFGGHSRTISNYWANYSLSPENKLQISTRDARSLGIVDGDLVRLTSKTNPEGTLNLGDGTSVRLEAKAAVIEGIRPGCVALSWHYGHWNAYGASDKIEIDGAKIAPDMRRATGSCSNMVNRVDESVGKVGLTDPISGSASFYDTRVRVEKVMT